MTYDEALTYLYSFVRLKRGAHDTHTPRAYDRFQHLLWLLGNPEQGLRCVQVAGTKGKGSTARMLQSILRAAGLRVGLYTSPHLHTFRERLRVDDELIGAAEMAAIVADFSAAVTALQREQPESGLPNLFELGTALAFLYFAAQQPDVVVLETGLGGGLDPTNVVAPLLSVITSISLDHTDVLGGTLTEIARAKGGIIKPGVPVVSSPQVDEVLTVLELTADIRESPLTLVGEAVRVMSGSGHWLHLVDRNAAQGQQFELAFAPDFPHAGANLPSCQIMLPLLGDYQQTNAATAVAAALLLGQVGYISDKVKIDEGVVSKGLLLADWPGRLEVLRDVPGASLLVVDGAHNPDAAHRLSAALSDKDMFWRRRLLLVLGTSGIHAPAEIVAALAPLADVLILTRSRHLRASDPTTLADLAHHHARPGTPIHTAHDVATALQLAEQLAEVGDMICCTGSIFVMAEVREAMGLAPDADRVAV